MSSTQVTGEKLGRRYMVPAVCPVLPPPRPVPGPGPGLCPPSLTEAALPRPLGASGPRPGSVPRDQGSPGSGFPRNAGVGARSPGAGNC